MAGAERKTGSKKNTEIERRFLVFDHPFNLEIYKNYHILQGYEKFIDESDDGMELRIRQKGDEFFETKKKGLGEVRKEFEKRISKEEFWRRWPNVGTRFVEKTRYEIPSELGLIEFDILHGKLTGLVVAEMEFPNKKASRNFVPFTWMGREITEDLRYTHQNLILLGLPEEITSHYS